MTYPTGNKGSYFKVCLIGDGGVGKTSLRERVLGEDFESTYLLTIGADFAIYQADIDGHIYKFQIWDLSGQQRFDIVRAVYYRGSHGAILVFDQTRPESFSNLENWRKELFTHVNRRVPFILLGNKCDLRSKIDRNALNEFIEKSEKEFSYAGNPFSIPYLDTSARTGHNVNEAFETLIMAIRNFVINNVKKTKH
ncbi:MAG: Rab family GTPase [Promethearchaeota archaeon]